MLSSDISRKRPDLDFDVGYFIDAIPQYNFLLGSRDGEVFNDITIFSSKEGRKHQTIIASSGTISTVDDGVVLHLVDGVIHEYQVMIPMDNMVMSRRDSKIRGDREMTYAMIKAKIKSYEEKITNTHIRIRNRLINEAEKLEIDSGIDSLTIINPIIVQQTLSHYEVVIADSLKKVKGGTIARVQRRLKNLSRGIESDFSLINSYKNSINKYLVELHKKFSIPFASIIFILIGAPLGMMARKGGFAVSMAFSLGFFIIYWAFLIGGEEFADRGLLSPALSMWLPNLVLGIFGLFICYWQSLEQRIINFELLNLFKNKNGQ